MTTIETRNYYADLLIKQYLGKPKAYAHIQTLVTPFIQPQVSTQTITFELAPTSGTFVLSYLGVSTAAINWNDSAATIQTKLQAVTGLSAVTVSGEISSLTVTVTFTDVYPPAELLVLVSSTLLATATPVTPVVTETDEILPLAVQNGFNLLAPNTAIGDQLDILGKYAGVTRTARGFTTQITLDDADFLTLITMAVVRNSAGSSLSDIVNFLHLFFPDQILTFDYKTMRMSFLIDSDIGSQELIQMMIVQKLLPVPMAVQYSVIYAPVINKFFGFRTYLAEAVNATPFNTYTDYQTDWPWLSYADAIPVPP